MINHLKGIFDEHGIPECFVSDNGPQYSSEEFKQFATNYGFEHVTSSPMYPRSNGFAERMVQTVKQLFTKVWESGQDPHLLCLRTTPIDHNTPSPCEILNGRKYRSNLPISGKKEASANYSDNLKYRQDLQKSFHDRSVKELPPLKPHEYIRVQDSCSKRRVPGQVREVLNAPRSYKVQTSSGSYRRNRKHLRQTPETFHSRDLQEDAEDHTTDPPIPKPSESMHDGTTRSPSSLRAAVPLRRSSRTLKPPHCNCCLLLGIADDISYCH